jgi:hypothetical protein
MLYAKKLIIIDIKPNISMMFTPTLEQSFSLAEKPVKALIWSYLDIFLDKDLISLSRKLGLGINYYKIPSPLVNEAKQMHQLLQFPNTLARNSFYYAVISTPITYTIQVKPVVDCRIAPPPETWVTDIALSVEPINNLHINKPMTDGVLSAASLVFYNLLQYVPCLSGCVLIAEGSTLRLHDKRFPTYNHPYKLYVIVEKIDC